MPSCSAWAEPISSGSTWPTRDATSSAKPKTGNGTCGTLGNLGIPANGGLRRGALTPSPATPTRPTRGDSAPDIRVDPRGPRREGARGGPQGGDPLAREGVGEKHVTGLGGRGVVDARPLGQPADLLECPTDAVGVARELDGAGVSQVLPLPRHRRHDQTTEERSHQ